MNPGRHTKKKRDGHISGTARQVLSLGFMAALILVWQAAAKIIGKAYLLPAPAAVLESLWKNRIEIFTVHLPATMEVVAIGGVLAVLLGMLFAILMDFSPRIKQALYPVLTVSQTIPVICIAPVLVLWLGYTVQMRVVVVILVNFFTITVNLYDGFTLAGQQRMELMQTYGADRLQSWAMLRMPSAMPYFMTALRITIPWSMIGAAVSEWLGAQSGLGMYSRSCMLRLDAAGLLAPLVVLTAVALIMTEFLNILERTILKKYMRQSLD